MALPPIQKIYCIASIIYVIITHGQNIQNDQKKELFFTPRSCGVSFCPGVSRGFFNFSLAITPLLQCAYHRRRIADHTVNRRAELFLHRADGLRPDVAVRCGFCPFLQLSDQRGSAGQFVRPFGRRDASTVFFVARRLIADHAVYSSLKNLLQAFGQLMTPHTIDCDRF